MEIKVDTKALSKLLNGAGKASEQVKVDAYEYFKQQTPKRSGNARNRTRLQNDSIVADYAYSQRLNEGWSKQAPNGMVDPTIEHIEKTLLPRVLRRATNGQ